MEHLLWLSILRGEVAYLITYIYDKITSVFYKLDKNFSKVSKALDLIADKDADCKAENKVVEYLGEY